MRSFLYSVGVESIHLPDRYQLQACIGEGGSALVYRALDHHLGREVAVKVLHDYVIPADRHRFEREIRTLAKLIHPNVVTIYDLGHTEDRRLFFTMQLLNGGAFHEVGPLEGTPESFERFFRVSRAVLYGLEYMHERGMIHRDLTPHNILFGADGLPRIMDFGLVYASQDVTRDLTRTGYTLGTPHYMAPEQARGGVVGPHSDIYAFGAVMYRALTGQVPFEGDNDQAVLYQHVYEPPVHPSEVNPAVPEPLAEAVLKFLEKDHKKRPMSGSAAISVIEEARDCLLRNTIPGQYRGGLARAGYHPGGPTFTRPLKSLWSVRLGTDVSWPSAVIGDRDFIAVGTRKGTVAVYEHTGRKHAEYSARDEVTAPVTLEGDRLVYGSWDGVVRSVDVRTGIEHWRHQARSEITTAPTRFGDLYLVAARDGHLHALHHKTGEMKWAFKTQSPLAGSPTIWASTVMLADEEGWVYGLDASTGKSLWKLQLSSVHATPVAAPISRDQLMLLVPTWEGELHALKLTLQNGRYMPNPEDVLEWTYDLEGEVWCSPAVHQGRVYMGSWAGQLYALDLHTGDDLWTCSVGSRITASPVVSSGVVYVCSEDGDLLALNEKTGDLVWKIKSPSGIQATPLLTDSTLYVAFMDGTLTAFR